MLERIEPRVHQETADRYPLQKGFRGNITTDLTVLIGPVLLTVADNIR